MKRLPIIIIVLALASLAMATPFIVADPQSATKYRVRLSSDNGVTWGAWVEGDPVAGQMKFDIGTTPAGNYKCEAQAGGDIEVIDSTSGAKSSVWKWSVSAPFLLRVTPGTTAVNIKVIE